MPDSAPDRRLLLVHAHPDDETINNGATMARYVREGVAVTLVTCTLGEMGEVLVPDLEHLAYHRDGGLGRHRVGELDEAMSVLGVTDHLVLGGAGRFHDSGMAWDEHRNATVAPDVPAGAFWAADLLEAATELVTVVRDRRPQVVVTYDDFGGYGHPDHVQAHRVTHYAVALAGARGFRPDLGEAWSVAKIYWTAMSEERLRLGLRALRDAGDTAAFEGMDPDGPLPRFAVPEALLDACVDGREHSDRKMDALSRHRTQVTTEGGFFALAGSLGSQVFGEEFYRLAVGQRGPVDAESGLETDLFAGIG